MANIFGKGRGRTIFPSAILALLLAGQPVSADDECNVRNIADMVKTIGVLRQVENSLNFLALSQADAIVNIATGVHTLELYNHKSGFFGPLGKLLKDTDKNESFLHNLDKSIRRLSTFETVKPRYEDLRENTNRIVGAGFDVHHELKAGNAASATRVYASTTIVALNEARADAYTAMSSLEGAVSKAIVRCR